MSATEKFPFSAEQIAAFERMEARRPAILRRFAAALEIWRGCGDRACIRARACRDPAGACLGAAMRALPDVERRRFRYELDGLGAGLSPEEAVARAQARIEAESLGPDA